MKQFKTAAILAAPGLVLAVPGLAPAWQGQSCWGGWGMGFGGGIPWLGPIFNILVLGVLIGAGVFIFKRMFAGAAPDRGQDTALSTLRRRYAAGEISKGEYESMKRDLAF